MIISLRRFLLVLGSVRKNGAVLFSDVPLIRTAAAFAMVENLVFKGGANCVPESCDETDPRNRGWSETQPPWPVGVKIEYLHNNHCTQYAGSANHYRDPCKRLKTLGGYFDGLSTTTGAGFPRLILQCYSPF